MMHAGSTGSSVTPTVANHEPWVNQCFLKDSRLRTVERYFRPANQLPKQKLQQADESMILILPDATTWRKYLRLIRAIVQENDIPFGFVLTESTAEFMDYRNQSEGEASAPQERSLLQRLLERNDKVLAYADLCVRTEMDEWDFLEYEKLSIMERSRHALLRAAHLLESSCWLIADDPNLTLPIDSEDNEIYEIQYKSIQEVIELLSAYINPSKIERLKELQLACQEEYQNRNAPSELEGTKLTELSNDEINRRIQRGLLFRGRLDVTKENIREAYVSGGGKTYFISKENMGVAFHQDMVVVEVLPESQWGRPVGKRRIIYNVDEEVDDFVSSSLQPVPSARVVAIDQPSRRTFVATMTDLPSNDDSGVLVTPMDIRIPKIRLRTRSWRNFLNVRLKIEVDDWEPGTSYPRGRCVEILGPVGDLETEIRALLIENEVELDPFSAEAIARLPSVGDQWRVTDKEVVGRKDLRNIRRIFSVDPPGCQDIDDTMHAEILENGDIEGTFLVLVRFVRCTVD
jgi:exoribonuclease R